MSSDMCSNPRPCNCEICKPFGPEPEAACVIDLNDLLREFERGVAKTARASDRLRAQRKRHAQRLAEVQAKLDEAEKMVTFLRGKIWDRAIRLVREEAKEVPPCT